MRFFREDKSVGHFDGLRPEHNGARWDKRYIGPMAKRKHIGTVILTILVAALLASGISGWLFWQSAQRVIG